MFGFVKTMFVALLASLVNDSNHTKFVFLNNQQFMTEPTLNNLYPNEYIERLCYYPFTVNLGRCMGSFSTLNDLFNRAFLPNKTEKGFNMVPRINKLKTLIKHVLCECKCKINGRKCNLKQKWNISKRRCGCKNTKEYHVCRKRCIWNPPTCTSESDKYLASTIDESVITCDEKLFNRNCSNGKYLSKFLYFTCHFISFYSVIRSVETGGRLGTLQPLRFLLNFIFYELKDIVLK